MKEKTRRRLLRVLRLAIIASPFVIGGIGFCILYKGSYISGFYDALCLYGLQLNVDKEDVNLLINIARWAAPLYDGSGIVHSAVGTLSEFPRPDAGEK